MDHTLLSDVLEWFSVVLGICGGLLVAYQIIWGFHIWIIANACIISLAILDGRFGTVFLFAFYTATSWLGIWRWSKNSNV